MADKFDQRFLDMLNDPNPNFWIELFKRHGITNFEDALALTAKPIEDITGKAGEATL